VLAFDFSALALSPVLHTCAHQTAIAMHKAGVSKKAPDIARVNGGIMGRSATGEGQRMLVTDLIERLQAMLSDHEEAKASSGSLSHDAVASTDGDEEMPF
jgi:hypothetical protein